jgi:hypothetical protein
MLAEKAAAGGLAQHLSGMLAEKAAAGGLAQHLSGMLAGKRAKSAKANRVLPASPPGALLLFQQARAREGKDSGYAALAVGGGLHAEWEGVWREWGDTAGVKDAVEAYKVAMAYDVIEYMIKASPSTPIRSNQNPLMQRLKRAGGGGSPTGVIAGMSGGND